MRRTGINFKWETSKNNDAIKVLEKNNIKWEYNHFGTLTADFYGIGIYEKIDFERVQGDVFEICAGSKNKVYSGCVYKEVDESKPSIYVQIAEQIN